ncbi:MAG: ABC transporter permease [Gemmatimonadaceae bacterium]|nr:ABC transporter permease [Gemmatimonadaceae bacterium]
MTPRRRVQLTVVVIALLVLAALAGPLVYRTDPDALDFGGAAAPPGAGHPLGTDESGRDVLARLLVGARVSLAAGAAAMLLSVALGTLVGSCAAMSGPRTDSVLMRFTDAALAIPAIFVVITVLTFVGPSVPTLVIAIGVTSWMGLARLVRGELLALKHQDFVEAAVALGERPVRRFVRHLLPHLWPTILVNATLGMGSALLTESALSFLGLGVQPPAASWGNMLSSAQTSMFSAPWLAVIPGLLILLAVASINVLGDALRDALHAGE